MLGQLFVHHYSGTSAIRQLASITRCDQATRQRRAQAADTFFSGAIANAFVVGHGDLLGHQTHDLIGHAHRHGNRCNFVLELASGQRSGGFLLAGCTVFVHRFAADVVTLGHLLRSLQHGPVDLGLILHEPRVLQHVRVHLLRGARNGFHAAGHINVAFVGHDALCCRGNSLQARRAKAIDGHARHGDGATCAQCDLAGDVGTRRAFGRAAAHDDVVHFTGLNAGAGNGLLHDVAAQGGTVGHVESTFPGLGQGGAGGRNDYC